MRIKGIHLKKELDKVKKGKRFSCSLFFCHFIVGQPLFTICVSKKHGQATKRNKIKRWFRIALQSRMKYMPQNFMCFFYLLKDPSFTTLSLEVNRFWKFLSTVHQLF